MNIYIDEAGAFTSPKGNRPHHYSLVLALVVPNETEADLFYEFLRLRDSWPRQGVEIKGSKLDEDQTAQVADLLDVHEVIAEYCAIDMVQHPDEIVDEFKKRQAVALTANLTPKHAETVARIWHGESEGIRAMSNPLFVQAFMMINLILELLDTAINYYVQRRPSELGRFNWTIDRKDHTVTQMEQLWSTLILPIGESESARHPYARVEGFDYSHFAKYEIDESTADEKTKRHLQWMRSTLPFSKAAPDHLRCINAKRIWTEERSFADSKDTLGLQLADIAASILSRALNGNLQPRGWKPISNLLIRKKDVPIVKLGKAAEQQSRLEPHSAKVWRILDANSKAMLLEPSG